MLLVWRISRRTVVAEVLGVKQQIVFVVLLWIPSQIEEELDGILHRFQVAYIEHPQFADTMLISKGQLFPHTLHLTDVHPFGITGCAYIVDMVVHAISSLAGFGTDGGQSSHVAPVVVTKQ